MYCILNSWYIEFEQEFQHKLNIVNFEVFQSLISSTKLVGKNKFPKNF